MPSPFGLVEQMNRKKAIIYIIMVLALGWIFLTFVARGYYISSNSMAPALYPGDRVLVDRLTYRFRDPSRFDIIVFKHPLNNYNYVKRIIGLPGETVEMRKGTVYINGRPLREPFIQKRGYSEFPPVKIPAEHYFVLGDNRDNSNDSRYWGFVRKDLVIGKVVWRFWPR